MRDPLNRRQLLLCLAMAPGAAALLGCRSQPADTSAQVRSPTQAAQPPALSLILCGPILRRVDASSFSVFLVLSAPAAVTLQLFPRGAAEPLRSATQRTVPIGAALHLVLVTVSGALTPGAVYEYDLRFEEGGRSRGLHDAGVLVAQGRPEDDLARLVYPGHQRPSFAVPAPAATGGLRLLHGSCRKPHGHGEDELARVDELLAASARGGVRPQHLLLTGDQIYADDVHPELLAAVRAVGQRLLGAAEEADADLAQVVGAASRQEALTRAGFSSTEAACHLITLGEFVGMYLLAFSDALWPQELAQQPELRGFARALPKVRRALANVSVSMIFDDHEITDDWYIREPWCDAVLGSALGRRVLRNGLAAYALFQHYGNVPEDFSLTGDRPGHRLLAQLAGWTGASAQGRDGALERLLGIPARGADLQRGSDEAVRWSYTLTGPDYQVVVLDTRTRRAFTAQRASLMSPAEIDARLAGGAAPPLSFVVSPAPVINLRPVEDAQQLATRLGRSYELDDEAWSHAPSYEHLLERLFGLGRVVVLSGDVHYGLCASATSARHPSACVLNLVSSSLRNSSLKKAPPPPLERVHVPPLRQTGRAEDVYPPSLVFHSHLADLQMGSGWQLTHSAWYQTGDGEAKRRDQRLSLVRRPGGR